MAMSENFDGNFSNSQGISQEDADAFTRLKHLSKELNVEKNLHVGLKDELDRHKQMIEKLGELERKVDLIIKHFSILPILGK